MKRMFIANSGRSMTRMQPASTLRSTTHCLNKLLRYSCCDEIVRYQSSKSTDNANGNIKMGQDTSVVIPSKQKNNLDPEKEKNSIAESTTTTSTTSSCSNLNEIRNVYVHPLSQIVLRHLQTSCHDWIKSKGLDTNLVIHRDGTFALSPIENQISSLRIWTYYDTDDRKHWLSMSCDQVRHRFLLQDNMLSSWRGSKLSLEERVQENVKDLMEAVNELHG